MGNKDIIKRDIFGIDLDKYFKKSIDMNDEIYKENGKNQNTFVIDETNIEYDHKTMARGKFKEK